MGFVAPATVKIAHHVQPTVTFAPAAATGSVASVTKAASSVRRIVASVRAVGIVCAQAMKLARVVNVIAVSAQFAAMMSAKTTNSSRASIVLQTVANVLLRAVVKS